MFIRPSRLAGAAAMLAALSMSTPPAFAAELPNVTAAPVQVESGAWDDAANHRWRRYGRHHNRVDAGDVVAGVVVLGVLGAILSSGNESRRERDRYEERRDDRRYDRRDDRRRDDDRNYSARGIDSAIDICVNQVESRDNRVDDVNRADRSASGWRITGTLANGEGWSCEIDNDGEVRSVDFGSGGRREFSESAPAYPGGLLAGEQGQQSDDGRYATADAPDFREPAI